MIGKYLMRAADGQADSIPSDKEGASDRRNLCCGKISLQHLQLRRSWHSAVCRLAQYRDDDDGYYRGDRGQARQYG
jgi:hypothetical protein